MSKDLMKFLVIVIILYAGFASTFVLLAKDAFQAKQILWLLVYVWNGSGYLGLDISSKISRELGPALMIGFVSITNILLIPTLISLLTNSLTLVMGNAREEFLFQYSILVLESCASKRLTYYFPPLNLIPLILLRPLRIVLQPRTMRSARIVLLKVTHAPFLGAILIYEKLSGRWQSTGDHWRTGVSGSRALGIPQHKTNQQRSQLKNPANMQRASSLHRGHVNDGIAPSGRPTQSLARLVDELREQVNVLEARLEAREKQLLDH